MSVLYFLLLVGVLVVIHELGHFAAAKLLDVKVLRFSFGYGRPLVRAKVGETEYQVAIFPLGGYVRILGIEGEAMAKSDAGRSQARRSGKCDLRDSVRAGTSASAAFVRTTTSAGPVTKISQLKQLS